MVTRKAFLKSGALAVFSFGIGGIPAFLAKTALAAPEPAIYKRKKTLVAIFQRGAMDGLMAVPPIDDPNYYKFRPHLALHTTRSAGQDAALDLGNGFGLHPAFRPFYDLYREGRFGIVHGIGSPNSSRSHFDAQDYMESGTPFDKSTASGWLNRAVGLSGHDASPFDAVSLTPAMPKSLYGPAPSIAIENLESFRFQLPGASSVSAGAGFEAMYQQTTNKLLNNTGKESFEAMKMVRHLDVRNYRPMNGADYPNTVLGRSLKQIAMLIKANVGLEVAFTESTGWDNHVMEGAAHGTFANSAANLSKSIAAFWTDLGSWQQDVTLMTMTEFGRTVHENGSAGTDHGRASCMFFLGNDVDGGKVHGTIPRLETELLVDKRDLPVTTDFRAFFADIADNVLNIHKNTQLFPGWNGKRISVMKS